LIIGMVYLMAQSSRKSPLGSGVLSEIEPLEQLARFSWSWAPLLCDPKHGCCDYHRCWSLIRLFQKGGALPAGEEFFRQELTSLVAMDRKRVLISGAADTGLMALVCTIFKALNVMPEIVLIDRCCTTVTQNRVMTSYLGLEADIRQADVRTMDCDPVDAVISHSFLGFFPEPDRQQVVDAWGRVLKPGGKVLMSTMLAQNGNLSYPAKDEAGIDASKPKLVESAMKAGMSKAEAQQLGEIAVAMFQKRLSHDPLLTRDSLALSFSKAGIELTEVTLKEKERLGPLAGFRAQSDLFQRGEVVGMRKSG